MTPHLACLIAATSPAPCAIAETRVKRVVPLEGWDGPALLEPSALGLSFPSDAEPQRVLLLDAFDGFLPLVVRGALRSALFSREEVLPLPSRYFGRGTFSALLLHEGAPQGLLLDPDALALRARFDITPLDPAGSRPPAPSPSP